SSCRVGFVDDYESSVGNGGWQISGERNEAFCWGASSTFRSDQRIADTRSPIAELSDCEHWLSPLCAPTFCHGDHNSTSDTARASRSTRQRAFAYTGGRSRRRGDHAPPARRRGTHVRRRPARSWSFNHSSTRRRYFV